jgi:hypothetical protein
MAELEFVVDDAQANTVVHVARATGRESLQRITVAPIDGTPRSRVVIAVGKERVRLVMHAVMSALERF